MLRMEKIDELYTQPSKTVSKFESNLAIDNNNNLLFCLLVAHYTH